MLTSAEPKRLNRFIHWIDKAHAVFLTALIGILAVGVIVSVILRYLFGLSSAWSEELLTMSFVASSFFGASLCLREKEHITMSLISGSASPSLKKILSIAVTLIILVICAFILYFSIVWISRVGKVPSPASGIPNGAFYLIMPVSYGFTILYAIVDLLAEFIHIEPPSTKSVFVGSSNDPRDEGGLS